MSSSYRASRIAFPLPLFLWPGVRHPRFASARVPHTTKGSAASPMVGEYVYVGSELLRTPCTRLSGKSEYVPLRGPTRLWNGATWHYFGRFALTKYELSDPHTEFPDSLWKRNSPKFVWKVRRTLVFGVHRMSLVWHHVNQRDRKRPTRCVWRHGNPKIEIR